MAEQASQVLTLTQICLLRAARLQAYYRPSSTLAKPSQRPQGSFTSFAGAAASGCPALGRPGTCQVCRLMAAHSLGLRDNEAGKRCE